MPTALLVPPLGKPQLIDIPDGDEAEDALDEAVGGEAECILSPSEPDIAYYVWEDGKYAWGDMVRVVDRAGHTGPHGSPDENCYAIDEEGCIAVNTFATLMLRDVLGPDCFIAGAVVMICIDPVTGEHCEFPPMRRYPLPERLKDWLTDVYLRARGRWD